MKNLKGLFSTVMPGVLIAIALGSCDPEEVSPGADNVARDTTGEEIKDTPFTSIPDELVGTWYADHNDNPLTVNWEQGTFQGETGFREFRTMVFTKDGKNAVEYTSEVYHIGEEVKQYMFKRTGTLAYRSDPFSLTFHVQSGKVRLFSNKFTGYQEADMILEEWPTYFSVLLDPEATTYTTSTNYLTAKRSDGASQYSVRYIKVHSCMPGGENPDPDDLYSYPPDSGTYVTIAGKYYPTVTIGDQEWMSVNYAGTGGMKDSSKPHYGTFFKYMDLKDIPIPAGWRIPSKQDYVKLLQSQGLVLTDWGTTDGTDLQSKKLLGQLMAASGWTKQDGYATNKSGFNAVPANYKVQDASPHGEGTNCYLWTSDVNDSESPMAFQIIQLPGETYASFNSFPIGYFPQHLPVRLVKDK